MSLLAVIWLLVLFSVFELCLVYMRCEIVHWRCMRVLVMVQDEFLGSLIVIISADKSHLTAEGFSQCRCFNIAQNVLSYCPMWMIDFEKFKACCGLAKLWAVGAALPLTHACVKYQLLSSILRLSQNWCDDMTWNSVTLIVSKWIKWNLLCKLKWI